MVLINVCFPRALISESGSDEKYLLVWPNTFVWANITFSEFAHWRHCKCDAGMHWHACVVSLARLSYFLFLSDGGRKRVWSNSHRRSVMTAHENRGFHLACGL